MGGLARDEGRLGGELRFNTSPSSVRDDRLLAVAPGSALTASIGSLLQRLQTKQTNKKNNPTFDHFYRKFKARAGFGPLCHGPASPPLEVVLLTLVRTESRWREADAGVRGDACFSGQSQTVTELRVPDGMRLLERRSRSWTLSGPKERMC